MKKFNICIDIDGTITDPYYYLEVCNRYFNKNITPQEVTQYNLEKIYGVTAEEFTIFYNLNKLELHKNQRIREDAVEVLNKLRDKHNLYFVSARDSSMEQLTLDYLSMHNISYDSLHLLGSHYKLDKARELSCDIFIEDSYGNADYLAENGFKVLLLDTYYNRQIEKENIIRVNNWYDIYDKMNEITMSE
jgi:uncharacterized HAD superfamily protein